MGPPEACVLQMNNVLWCHLKEAQNHSHRPFSELFPAGGMTCISQFKQSLAIFKDTFFVIIIIICQL